MNDQHRIKAQLIDELEQTRTRVAELEQVEAALRKSEERYRSLVESTDDSVYLLGRDLRYEFANRKYLSRLGLSLAELIGQEYGKLHPSDASEEVAKKVDQVIKSGKPMVYEHLSHRDDRYFLRTLSPVIGEKPGKIRAITVTSKDITERKRTEEALKQRTYDMGERLKELNYMYELAKSIHKRETLGKVFGDVVTLIPSAWQYPEYTCARLRFDKAEYVSEPFKETEWKLSSDIIVGGEPRGSVEVYYLESRPELDEGPFLKEERQLLDGITTTLTEAIEHRRAEEALSESEKRLEKQNELLNDKNAALREMIRQIDDEKNLVKNKILANVNQLIMPIIARLRGMDVPVDRMYIDLLEESLNNIISGFGYELYKKSSALSSREIEIGNMIRNGLTTKEIARMLNLSNRTIDTHRNNIRKKLRIHNKNINLTSYLKSL